MTRLLIAAASSIALTAQAWDGDGFGPPLALSDPRGTSVRLPMGAMSFADQVVSFKKGEPAAPEADSDPRHALGKPNYDKRKEANVVTLGCGGALVLRFADNALVDVPGPDLHVFEVGDIEPTTISISSNGLDWKVAGQISGRTAAIDIARAVSVGEVFHFVRLEDQRKGCEGKWPGSDIDAVAAIGAAPKLAVPVGELLDANGALKAAPKKKLLDMIERLAWYEQGSLSVEAHTDNAASRAEMTRLGETWAAQVRDFIAKTKRLQGYAVGTKAHGDIAPVAPNDTPEGKEKNRRVEIVFVPPADEYKPQRGE